MIPPSPWASFVDRVGGNGGAPAPTVDDDPTLCPVCHRDACDDASHQPPPLDPEAKTPAAWSFQPADTLIREPRPVEIVEGIVYAGRMTVLVSESGAGKTFVLLDLGAAVSSDQSWHGRAVHGGSVAYCSYEGDALGLRLRALRDHTGRRLDHLHVLRAHEPLSPRVTRDGEERSLGERAVVAACEALAAELRAAAQPPLALLVIDTVRASLAGSEDSSEHVAAYLRAVRRVMTAVPGAGAVLAHHAGWQDGDTQRKRERGSSAWRGNCDVTLYLEAGETNAAHDETALTLRALKVRDAERPAPLHLVRRRVELAEAVSDDLRRGPVTSCIIDRDRRSLEDRARARAAAEEAQRREVDLLVLRAMRDYPTATNITQLRPLVGQRMEIVSASVARVLRAQLAREGRRNQPFILTDAGVARLNGGAR